MSSLSLRYVLVVAVVALASAVIGGLVASVPHANAVASGKLLSDDKLTVDDWLLGAASDEERFRRLQTQLSGWDQPMWEVGERFRKLHEALTRENYEMALFQWWKIEQRIRNAAVKRPKRAPNAQAFFLGENYQRIKAAFETRTPQSAWAAFSTAKGICQACHLAEGSGFVNQESVFDLAPPEAYADVSNKQ